LQQFGQMPVPPAKTPMTIADLVSVFGLNGLKGVTVQGGFRGVETRQLAQVLAPSPRTGLLKLLEQRSLKMDELPPMPGNTDSFTAFTMDVRSAVDITLKTAEELVTRIEGPQESEKFTQAMDRAKQVLGGDPRDVLSAGLGDVFCLYNDPTSMPIPMGIGPVLCAGVSDRTALTNNLQRLLNVVQQLPNTSKLSIRESEKDGQTYFSFSIEGAPIVPTIMVTDTWMVVSLMPGAAQSFAARLAGRLPKWEPNADVTAALEELPKEFTSLTVSDPAPGYNTMMMWAPMAVGMLETNVLPQLRRSGHDVEMPFSLQDLPTAAELTAPMFPNVAVNVVDDNGVATHMRQSVPGIPIGNVGSAAVIPVMVALLLPAVQAAREAARRTQSRNNLKQIGLAMHNYHDVFSHFPQGTVDNPDLKPEQRLSWVGSLLPFLEQVALYNQIDQKSAWNAGPNLRISQTRIPVFQNPSQTRPANQPASIDYVGISGIGPNSAELPITDRKVGIFGFHRKTKIRDITDGTSNTIAVADAAEPGESYLKGGTATIRGFSQQPYVNGPDGIGSPHPGGFQVLFADGSVRFVSENTDPQTLEALATIHGGERVGDF
ncbi:MAG: DUF1559 domain-containing protein, partial [Planctomycetaceae bacterium]|nr:DUF1559 domain-containing protein [Planctomycetaceae bacterium]